MSKSDDMIKIAVRLENKYGQTQQSANLININKKYAQDDDVDDNIEDTPGEYFNMIKAEAQRTGMPLISLAAIGWAAVKKHCQHMPNMPD